jgi:hypothetical protein
MAWHVIATRVYISTLLFPLSLSVLPETGYYSSSVEDEEGRASKYNEDFRRLGGGGFRIDRDSLGFFFLSFFDKLYFACILRVSFSSSHYDDVLIAQTKSKYSLSSHLTLRSPCLLQFHSIVSLYFSCGWFIIISIIISTEKEMPFQAFLSIPVLIFLPSLP